MAGGGRAWLSTAMSGPQSNVSCPCKPGLLGTPPPYVHLSRRLAAQGARATQPMLASEAGALGAGPHRPVPKEPISTARGASGPQGGTCTSPGRAQLWHLQAWCTARTGQRSSFLARTPACHLLGCSLPVISWVVRYLTSCFSARGCPWGQHRPSGTGRPPPGPTLPTRPWQRRLAPWVSHAGPSWGWPRAPSACTRPITPSHARHTSSKTLRASRQCPWSIKGPLRGSRTQRPRPRRCPGHLSPLTTPHHRASA